MIVYFFFTVILIFFFKQILKYKLNNLNIINWYDSINHLNIKKHKKIMDSTECCVCHKNNDQLLMLSCGHDPCIDCAATNYFKGA